MSALAAIHAKRRQVHSLREDDAWRDFVEKHTGQRSTRGLTPKQTNGLLAALDDMGAAKAMPSKRRRRSLEGPYAKKIQALWIGCWNLGIIQDRDDKALNAFAVHQAKVDHANWIREQADAVAVIEALKKMMARHGVDWTARDKASPDYSDAPGFRIAYAQWAKLPDQPMSLAQFADTLVGKRFDDMLRDDWIILMNALGRMVRAQAAEAG